jgi:hypothetical protein
LTVKARRNRSESLARGFAPGTPSPSLIAASDHWASSNESSTVTSALGAMLRPPEITSIWLTTRHASP